MESEVRQGNAAGCAASVYEQDLHSGRPMEGTPSPHQFVMIL
jgi:hypothetical protein